jgi:PncC family amidohydrolase
VAAAVAGAGERLGADGYRPPPGGRIEHCVVAALRARGERVATAESVTGGGVARLLTRVPGASEAFPVGWVVYATVQKQARLGVAPALLAAHGVVSAEVAVAMAEGARARAGTDAAIATTGSAGPDALREADGRLVPPGLAFVAVAHRHGPPEWREVRARGDRETVQRRVAVAALDLLRRRLARAG